ncbi:ABC transporter permease [Paenibacillus sp. PAMC21692]|uniref:ABC transporter permease n=1 Tax=Paenibacillus sp. PAMC21692 TaxID=2762320 RepID=UPI00164DE1D4|nr:ABC transporter permease [Paenibacillus sp. PAMC21692]QNK56919.1 ABC transporter permease [Paenibacillus sp. PAMC21692]
MLNILRMDFRRFRKNNMLPLLLAVFFAFQLFGIFMMSRYADSYSAGLAPGSMSASEFFQYMLAQPPSWMLLYVAVFTVHYTWSERSAGFYKNYISMRHARVSSVLAKALLLALFTLLLFVAAVAANALGRLLFFENAPTGELGQYALLLLLQFLLHWAFAVMMLFVALAARSLIAGLIIGLLLALNLVGYSLSALAALLLGEDGAGIASWWLVNRIVHTLELGQGGAGVLEPAIVALLFLLLFGAAGAVFRQREDLR